MPTNIDDKELARLVAKAHRRPKPGTFEVLRNAVPALVAEVRRLRWQAELWRETTTCFDCAKNTECEYAFDAYNTNGDCLAIK